MFRPALAPHEIVMGNDCATSTATGRGNAAQDTVLFEPGALLGGRYRIDAEIGRGGMAVVYRAINAVGTPVAVKTPHATALAEPEHAQRFLQESRALARLSGARHIVQVLDKHEGDERTPPYLVMELLTGRDLGRELERGPLSQSAAVGFALQVCDALADAHLAGLVHRDLKPGNLFLTRDREGTPTLKLLDLGVAKVSPPDSILRTETGAFVGTPPYAAPEQLRSARKADERSDVWSLGVTLYEMLTGHRPFNGKSRVDVETSFRQTPIPPSCLCTDLSAGLEEIILACLEQDPDKRPSVAQLARRLSDFAPRDLRSQAESIERRLAGSPDSTRARAARTEERGLDKARADSRLGSRQRSSRPPTATERTTLAPHLATMPVEAPTSPAQRRASLTGPIALGAVSALAVLALWGGFAQGLARAASGLGPPAIAADAASGLRPPATATGAEAPVPDSAAPTTASVPSSISAVPVIPAAPGTSALPAPPAARSSSAPSPPRPERPGEPKPPKGTRDTPGPAPDFSAPLEHAEPPEVPVFVQRARKG